jgi:ubiquinone/menaquinone biosynthesis C-methylase UbiE
MSRSDPVADHNKKMWDRLAKAGHPYTRGEGKLPKTATALRRLLDPNQRLTGFKLRGARVLALAAGGGWDGIIFAKLGADVTVLDLSTRQVRTAKSLAKSQGVKLQAVEGNMKDLSRFADDEIDLVWHCHSLVFIDDIDVVFREVGRVLKPGGTYITGTMHPTTLRLYRTFDGRGWRPLSSYYDNGPIPWIDDSAATWEWDEGRVLAKTIEYGHRIETLINGMVASGMVVDGLWEYGETEPDFGAEPGTDEHLETLFPPYVQIRARKLPLPK